MNLKVIGFVCLLVLLAVGCTEAGAPGAKQSLEIRPVVEQTRAGPVLAQVANTKIHRDEVVALAAQAQQLRAQFDIETLKNPNFEQQLDLAIEFVILATAAGRQTGQYQEHYAEQQKRSLARVYLNRFLLQADALPVTAHALEKTYEMEQARALVTGSSAIFRPTTVDMIAVVVGLFPDLHVPKGGEQALLTIKQAKVLARKLRGQCPASMVDTDDFMDLARTFMASHPTVTIQEFWGVKSDRKWSRLQPVLRKSLLALQDFEISEPIVTDVGVWILRRGATHAGMGESFDQVRPQLTKEVIEQRRADLFRKHMTMLSDRYRIETWPGRLAEGQIGSP